MARATHEQVAQRLNAAIDLLASGQRIGDVVDTLIERHGLSRRQAYRYLQRAKALDKPVDVGELTIPMTVKVPADVVAQLRSYAAASGMTIGQTVTHAVRAFLTKADRHG